MGKSSVKVGDKIEVHNPFNLTWRKAEVVQLLSSQFVFRTLDGKEGLEHFVNEGRSWRKLNES